MPKFACATTCMDGRIQAAVRKHLRAHYGVDYTDVVAFPGMNKFLANNKSIRFFWARLILFCLTLQVWKVFRLVVLYYVRWMTNISVLNHRAGVLAIVGHAECAGNTCCREKQIEHLIRAKRTIDSFGFEVEITLLWVHEDWKTVEVVDPEVSRSGVFRYDVRTAAT